jgi:hypothetical protein
MHFSENDPMPKLIACLWLVALCPAIRAEPDNNRVKELLQSENYTVTWGAPVAYPRDAELEIGDGNGHGGNLGWLRFQPGKDGVEVLSIQFSNRQPYRSKWPPDIDAVTVQRGRLKLEAYAALLGDLAVIDAAKVQAVERDGTTSFLSTNDFWAYARLTTSNKMLLELNWAGYEGSETELEFARPRAAARLARDAIQEIEFQDHALSERERAWTSAKFARDWQSFKGREFYWWVRERYIKTIGVVGDKSVLPVLRDILATDPPLAKPRDVSDNRCIYYAINAVIRLTRRDVRDRPIEEMDIEKTRQKVLEVIDDTKRE